MSDTTREAVIDHIRRDLLLGSLDLGGGDLRPDDIDESTRLFGDGLDIDSVDSLDLLVALEKRYGFRLPELDAELIEQACHSVGSLADFVMTRLKEAEGV